MGANLPAKVAETNLSRVLAQEGFKLLHRGKVRDTYELPKRPELLLVVATDRVSVFDFVLPCLIPGKGAVLTALTVFWLTKVLKDFPHHLVAFGQNIDQYLPFTIRRAPELQSRAVVVNRLEMCHYEAVVRAYLTGNAWKEYLRTNGYVWGHNLPPGLREGQKLPQPIFTPTTKSNTGHDTPISITKFRETHGREAKDLSLQIFCAGSMHAASRGIILVDTKFEFGQGKDGLIVGDEVLTPDSSRFWEQDRYNKAMQQYKLPPALDKQYVRDYCESLETPFRDEEGKPLKFSKLDPTQEGHLIWAWSVKLPQKVIDQTGELYQQILSRLTK